jgi:hypothetical protein
MPCNCPDNPTKIVGARELLKGASVSFAGRSLGTMPYRDVKAMDAEGKLWEVTMPRKRDIYRRWKEARGS